MVGLSGYGFRLKFFEGWCPSSPDATCGKDVGSVLLENLGFEFEMYALETKNIDKFDVPPEKITELIKLYSDEIVLLEKGFENIPSPFGGEEKADWNSQLRERQILTLTKFLEIEEKVKRHLNSLNI